MKSLILSALAAISFAAIATSASAAGQAERDIACTHSTVTTHGVWDCR